MALKLEQICAIETALESQYDSKIYALEKAQTELNRAEEERLAVLARRTANVETMGAAEAIEMQAVAIWTASVDRCLPAIQVRISNAKAELEKVRAEAAKSFARLEGAKRMKDDVVKELRKQANKTEENAIEALVQVSRAIQGQSGRE